MPVLDSLASVLSIAQIVWSGLREAGTFLVGGWRGRRGEVLRVENRGLSRGNVWLLATQETITEADMEALDALELRDVRGWLEKNKSACISGERRDDLLLTGAWQKQVFIEEVVARIERRSTDSVGALINSPNAGARTAILLGFDLTDGADRRAVVVEEDIGLDWTTVPYFPSHDIVLAPQESQSLSVISRTGEDTVWWRLVFKVRAGKQFRELIYPPVDQQSLVTTCHTRPNEYWMTGVATGGRRPWLRPAHQFEWNALQEKH